MCSRAGDPAAVVQSAASASVTSVCAHGGCGSLARLVGDNADYIVDGVCAQARSWRMHREHSCLHRQTDMQICSLMADTLRSEFCGLWSLLPMHRTKASSTQPSLSSSHVGLSDTF